MVEHVQQNKIKTAEPLEMSYAELSVAINTLNPWDSLILRPAGMCRRLINDKNGGNN